MQHIKTGIASAEGTKVERQRTPMVYPARYAANSKFGAMFLWTGCICQALWTCGSVSLKPELSRGDFAPIFIYSALAVAGIALTLPKTAERSPAREGDWLRRLIDAGPQAKSVVTEGGAWHLGANVSTKIERHGIMAIGPLATVQSALGPLFQSSGVILEYAETAAIALQKLRSRPRSALPKVLIMRCLIPAAEGPGFIRAIKSDQALGEMSIIVWGAGMPAHLIPTLYWAGATCVIPSELDEVMSRALYDFCTAACGHRH